VPDEADPYPKQAALIKQTLPPMRKRFIRLTNGDRVKLEMSPYDLDKARIVYEARGVCLILDDVVCSGNYADGRIFCSRSIYSYWHEVWLRRVEQRPEVDDR
jgi:hypothetical protein